MKRWPGVVAAVAAVAALAAGGCGTESPTPGNLVVTLSGTGSARAMTFTVVGKVTAVSAPAGSAYRYFSFAAPGDSTRVAVIAPAGQTLAAGAILTLAVPDTRAAAQYRAVVADVAAATYQLVSATPFTLSVSRP